MEEAIDMRAMLGFTTTSVLVLFLASGCGDDTGGAGGGSGGSGGAGTGGDASTTTSSSTTNATTATSTGAGGEAATTGAGGSEPTCTGIITEEECGACAEGLCCDETAACGEDEDCAACAGGDAAACDDTNAAWTAVKECLNTFCTSECAALISVVPTCDPPDPSPSAGSCIEVAGDIECNPVTGAPCDLDAGETCDWTDTGFICYPAPNDAAVCDSCDAANGPFCGAGTTCENLTCAKYCCDDDDCGSGVCAKGVGQFPNNDVLGLCLSAQP